MTIAELVTPELAGDRRVRRRATLLWAGGVFAGTLLSAVFLYHQMWAHPATSTMGTYAHTNDQMQSMWFLKWMPWRLVHGHNPFHSANIYYPDGVNLAWNTATPTLAFLAAPLTFLTNAALTYNVLMTLAPAATTTTAYLWLRRHVSSHTAAIVGGLLVGFGPFATGHLKGHLHLVFNALVPVMLILFEDLLWRRPRPQVRTAVYLGIVTAAQLGISEETVVLTAIGVAIAVLAYLLVDARRLAETVRESAAWLGAAVAVAVAVAAPLLIEQLGNVRGYTMHNAVWRATRNDYLFPGSNQALQLLHGHKLSVGGSEDGVYVGVVLLAVLVCGVAITWRSRFVRCAALTAAVLALFSFGDIDVLGVPLPWHYLAGVSLFSSILPIRFAFAGWLAVAWLVAYWLNALLPAAREELLARRPRVAVAGVAAIAAALVTLVPHWIPATRLPDVPRYLTAAHAELPDGAPVVLLPSSTPHDASSMYLMQEAGFRYAEPGGYAYRPNGDEATLWARPTPLTRFIEHRDGSGPSDVPAARIELTQLHYRAVIVVQGLPQTPQLMTVAQQLTGRAPDQITGGVAVWLLR